MAEHSRKIPPELVPELLARHGKGETSPQLASWFLDAHGIEITSRSIRRFLASRTEERREAVRSVVAEKLAPVVDGDLVALGEIAERLKGYADKAEDAGKLNLAIRASEAEANVRATRLKLAGAGGEDEKPATSARDRLLEKLERLVNPAAT